MLEQMAGAVETGAARGVKQKRVAELFVRARQVGYGDADWAFPVVYLFALPIAGWLVKRSCSLLART